MGYLLLAVYSFVLAPALVCGGLSAALGDAGSGGRQRVRRALLGLSVLALLLVVLACVLAGLYPPTEKFPPGSRPLREFMQGAAEILTLLLPFWLARVFSCAWRVMQRPQVSVCTTQLGRYLLVITKGPLRGLPSSPASQSSSMLWSAVFATLLYISPVGFEGFQSICRAR